MKRSIPAAFVWIILAPGAHAQPGPDDLFARVVDVGAGMCCVARMPGDFYMIYDAGFGSTRPFEAVAEIIPDTEEVDLMVLSHPDSDHLGAVRKICNAYKVKRVIRTGYERPDTDIWVDADKAVRCEVIEDGCRDVNLRDHELPPGATYRFGDTFVTVVSGFHEPPAEWGLTEESERRNSISIVVRLLFAGRSILVCGDTVGRHIGDPGDVCIAAERVMVDNAPVIVIDSDVMIAPHHGADNGSSTAFIQAVSPEFVVFSAGSMFGHPRKAVSERYLANGVGIDKMFRTDLGDDEGDAEWDYGRIAGHNDPAGDDDVDIVITADGQIEVKYRNAD